MSEFYTTLEVTPLSDGENWRINAPFRYESDLIGVIEVPFDVEKQEGFITDFASVPNIVRNLLPVWNRYGPAAVVHDWLYWNQATKREDADSVLLEAMHLLGVDKAEAKIIYDGVRIGGQIAWNRNAQLKKNGYTRMASAKSNPPYAQVSL